MSTFINKLNTKILTAAFVLSVVLTPAFADTVPVPTLGENSAYTLTKVEQEGENTITKYEWSNTENKYVPVYYRVDLNKTEYGNPNGDTTLTYGWEKNADGNLEFKQDPTTPVGQAITYKYSESDFSKIETHTLDKGTIENLSGSYSNPTIIASGAAINNKSGSTISIDNVLFKDNITTATIISTSSSEKYANVLGGAVYNSGNITSITGAFVNNGIDITTSATNGYLSTSANGGAIANKGTIGDINADFIGNYAQGSSSNGVAIYNYGGTIGNITGEFIGNKGNAIYNYYRGKIGDITGNFIGNNGSAVSNIANYFGGNTTIGNITGDFIGNYDISSSFAEGAAIMNINGATIGNITGDFINNYAYSTSVSNSYAQGGAIYYSGDILTLKDCSFINNGVIHINNANGGALFIGSGTINIIADKKDVIFDGNYKATAIESDGTLVNKKPDGIYVEAYNDTDINLYANDKNIIINDSIVTKAASNERVFVNLLNGTLKFGKDAYINILNTSFGTEDVNNVTLDVQNSATSEYTLGNITLNSDLIMKIDADLAAEKVDSFNVSNVISNGHSINIENFNILSDLGDADFSASKFITTDQVKINISDSIDAYLTSNYKYDISILEDSGNSYLFVKKEGISLGLPYAIKEKGNVVYSQTEDEVINKWIISSDVQSDKFTLNGNNHTITSTNDTTGGLYLAAGKSYI